MDPFGIKVGAIGITESATNSIGQLHSLIDSLTEAKDVISDIASSLAEIERPLAALEELSISDGATSNAARENLRQAGVAETVNRCGEACDEFGKNLKKWAKYSRYSLRDRLSVGVWDEKMRTLRTRLQSCEKTVQFALTSTQMVVQSRAENMSAIERRIMLRQLYVFETMIEDHLDSTRKKHGEALTRMRELQEESDDEEDGGVLRTMVIKEIEEQSRILEADQLSCGVVFLQVRSKRSGQDIDEVITSTDSKALVGLPESVVGMMNQHIGKVLTEKSSTAVVGVYGNNISVISL